ncbi:MAG: dihydroneopterin aldolase [Deltaproteobacteria bacterium]|nr:dihydroneopterin aldolase [Deltaproteobacteria bacterium]
MIERGAIVIRGIQFQASHGASAEERRQTRRFEVDLEIQARDPIAKGGETDRLADTVDYLELCTLVIRVGTEATCHLVEKVARRILDAVGARHPAAHVTVEVRKLDPPCPGAPKYCGVRIAGGPLTRVP